MNISQAIITSINESALLEKASIDWNNYLTPEEVDKFLSKDDKVESAENIIYSKEFKPRYKDLHNDLQKKYKNSWTKRELVKDLADFYYNGHLITESVDRLWKSQIDKKDKYQLETYIDKLYKQLRDYEETDIKSSKYYDLLNKIEYIESKLGNKPKIGRELH